MTRRLIIFATGLSLLFCGPVFYSMAGPGPKSKLRTEYDQNRRRREAQQAAEKSRLARGPSAAQLKSAGSPAVAAAKFILAARNLRTPTQLKPYLTKQYWTRHQANVKNFNPSLAKKQLAEIGNRKDAKATLTRRINTHPDQRFVAEFASIGKVREITETHMHPTEKFKAVVVAKMIPDEIRDSWGNKAPTATMIFVLENGRWKFESHKFSIGVFKSGR